MFLPHPFKNEIKALALPRLLVKPEVLEDMYALVHATNEEVGWLGLVKKEVLEQMTCFILYDIFVPRQAANAGTCELKPEGIAESAMGLLEKYPDEPNILNHIRFWGHSHHTMGTSPSGQDITQMNALSKDCTDFFIRAILNQKNRMEVRLEWREANLVVDDWQWEILLSSNIDVLRQKIEDTKGRLKDLVTRPVYTGYKSYGGTQNRKWQNGGWVDLDDDSVANDNYAGPNSGSQGRLNSPSKFERIDTWKPQFKVEVIENEKQEEKVAD